MSITEELADDGTVLLLDSSLVVLAIGSRASELDLTAEAVMDQRLVHKLAAVINVRRAKREGWFLAYTLQCLDDQPLSRTASGAASVQPLAISVITSLLM